MEQLRLELALITDAGIAGFTCDATMLAPRFALKRSPPTVLYSYTQKSQNILFEFSHHTFKMMVGK